MIPIRDNIPTRTPAIINYLVIGVCTLVFLAQQADPPEGPSLIEKFGMIPARMQDPQARVEIPVGVELVMTPQGPAQQTVRREAAPAPVPPILTLLTCIFLHGGWLHFLGNMWFLHIFGDNVEDRFGHFDYLLFYLVCGVVASGVHYLSNPSSAIPTIGASGAIAGVMGAYFIWYPRAQVQAVIPIFILLYMVVLPAPIFLGIWFLMQLLSGAAASGEAGGVAWWAHVGGFAAGVVIAVVMNKLHMLRPANLERRPVPSRMKI